MEIGKNVDFEELGINGRHHQILREKLLYVDLLPCLYDPKWSKILPVHVRKRSYMSVHNCMYACALISYCLELKLYGSGCGLRVFFSRKGTWTLLRATNMKKSSTFLVFLAFRNRVLITRKIFHRNFFGLKFFGRKFFDQKISGRNF